MDQVLATESVRAVLRDEPRPAVVRVIREVLDSIRDAVRAGGGEEAVPPLEDVAASGPGIAAPRA